MLNLFLRKKSAKQAPSDPPPVSELREDLFDPGIFSDALDEGIRLTRIVKPFYRVSSDNSYIVYDVYPAFKCAKKKNLVKEIHFNTEKELALIINAEVQKEAEFRQYQSKIRKGS